MGLSLSQIINKFLPTKRVDDDLRENPHSTAFGQEVTAIEESFWSRKLRYGRPAFNYWDGTAITGSTYNTFYFYCGKDVVFTPNLITFSADVDCASVKITYLPIQNYNPYQTSYAANILALAYLKAGQPLQIKLDGDISVSYPQGFIAIQVYPTATGKMYANIHGIETPITV